ncbi:MAG: hypothetical protein ABSA76_15815 [Bacteroidales bacterium]
MRESKRHNKQLSPATEEFLDSISPFAEKCPQLQIFLHRMGTNNDFSDYEFLMVTPNTFGKVKIQDILVEEPNIFIEYRDFAMDQIGHLGINVYDPNPKVLFIAWKDVKDMVMVDKSNIEGDPELLEFDY